LRHVEAQRCREGDRATLETRTYQACQSQYGEVARLLPLCARTARQQLLRGVLAAACISNSPFPAAHAFNVFQRSMYQIEIVRLCAIWDGVGLDKENIPTVVKLINDDKIIEMLAD